MRVVQRRGRPGFSLEPVPRHRVVRQFTREDFEGDRAIQASVTGLVHFAHAAGAQRRGDLIGAQAGPGGQ